METPEGRSLRIAIIAGEHSGDRLAGKLMAEMNARAAARGQHPLRWAGVGGPDMEAAGLTSLYPLADVAVMGPVAILKALPRLVARVYSAVDHVLEHEPDLLVIVDSPEFTHPIAKRVRKRRPEVPIIDYVSPTVWAWRPGRAKKMAPYVDHLLALLPFEPDAHARLGGPPCTYVGHPLVERLDWIGQQDPFVLRARHGVPRDARVLVVLPGSRMSEVMRLGERFRETIDRLAAAGPLFVFLPTVPGVADAVRETFSKASCPIVTLSDEGEKFAAFRAADAALAASGTVTLELAAAGCPMVVSYDVDAFARQLRFLVKTDMFALANLVLGEKAFPELMVEACEPGQLSGALGPLLDHDSPERASQLEALARIADRIAVPGNSPTRAAADVVERYLMPSAPDLPRTPGAGARFG